MRISHAHLSSRCLRRGWREVKWEEREREKGRQRKNYPSPTHSIMTCKQEFLVLKNGESLLPCRITNSFPSWRVPPLFSTRSLCRWIHPGTNDPYIYPRRCLSSAPLVFASLQLDERYSVGLISDSLLSARDGTQGERSGCRCIAGIPEIDFGVSDLPMSVRAYPGGTFAHLIRQLAPCR